MLCRESPGRRIDGFLALSVALAEGGTPAGRPAEHQHVPGPMGGRERDRMQPLKLHPLPTTSTPAPVTVGRVPVAHHSALSGRDPYRFGFTTGSFMNAAPVGLRRGIAVEHYCVGNPAGREARRHYPTPKHCNDRRCSSVHERALPRRMRPAGGPRPAGASTVERPATGPAAREHGDATDGPSAGVER